jgi:phosphoribosylformylglycinamidine synthase
MVTDSHDRLKISANGNPVADLTIATLDSAFNKTFGDKI